MSRKKKAPKGIMEVRIPSKKEGDRIIPKYKPPAYGVIGFVNKYDDKKKVYIYRIPIASNDKEKVDEFLKLKGVEKVK